MKTKLITAAKAIQNAVNLDHLLILLRDFETLAREADDDNREGAVNVADLDRLPTWGDDYRGDDLRVSSWNATRLLRQSDNPDDGGWTIEDRTDVIFPAGGWKWSSKSEAFAAVVASYVLSVWGDSDKGWFYDIVGPDKMNIRSENPIWSAQRASEWATDRMVERLNDLPPVQMISVLNTYLGYSHRQAEMAMMLGVSQPSVSQWLSGSAEMSRPVRAHIMRILGIERFQDRADRQGRWVIR